MKVDGEPLAKVGKSDSVAEILRHEIATGVLAVGTELPSEVEVARRFGVSRPSYREALRVLLAEGLITVTRGARGGARVVEPDFTTIQRPMSLFIQREGATLDDLLAAMELCEPVIVRELAAKLNRTFVRDLAESVARQNFSLDDRDSFNEAEWAFRQTMIANSNNKIMRAMCGLFGFTFYRHIRVLNNRTPDVAGEQDRLRRSIATKQKFVAALSEGQADEAVMLWSRYIHAFHDELTLIGSGGPIEVYNAELPPQS